MPDRRRFAIGKIVDLQPGRISIHHKRGRFSHFTFDEFTTRKPADLEKGELVGICYIIDRMNPAQKNLRWIRRCLISKEKS